MKIPRISNPEEWIDIVYTDRGNIDNPNEYISEFIIDGEKTINRVISSSCNERYKSDCIFLRQYDLDLFNSTYLNISKR